MGPLGVVVQSAASRIVDSGSVRTRSGHVGSDSTCAFKGIWASLNGFGVAIRQV